VDLLDDDAPDGVRVLHALLDAGLLEAWQDQRGHVRLRPPDQAGIAGTTVPSSSEPRLRRAP
jgi:hypothetical protein